MKNFMILEKFGQIFKAALIITKQKDGYTHKIVIATKIRKR